MSHLEYIYKAYSIAAKGPTALGEFLSIYELLMFPDFFENTRNFLRWRCGYNLSYGIFFTISVSLSLSTVAHKKYKVINSVPGTSLVTALFVITLTITVLVTILVTPLFYISLSLYLQLRAIPNLHGEQNPCYVPPYL